MIKWYNIVVSALAIISPRMIFKAWFELHDKTSIPNELKLDVIYIYIYSHFVNCLIEKEFLQTFFAM
jgi:hypothetical protein